MDIKDITNNKDINLTALGLSGSGKTCFLLGMYYEMSAGINGYTLTTENDEDDVELRQKWKKLKTEQGKSRFPTGTDRNGDYQFDLEYAHQQIKSFHWMDYKGEIIESKSTENPEAYEELSERIANSDCLCLFVDGKLLCEKTKTEMINNVTECARNIIHCFSDYKKIHDSLPPIAIIVTKFDLCKDYITENDLPGVMKKSFSSLFTPDGGTQNEITIIPVSLGKDITDEEYCGSLAPLNMHKPLFWGLYKPLKKDMEVFLKEQKKRHNQLSVLQNEYEKLDKKIFHKKKKQELNTRINKCKENVKNIDEIVMNHRKYVRKVHSELIDLLVFQNGSQRIITESELGF